MAKLDPPVLDNTLPAFYKEENKAVLTIYFQLSPLVNFNLLLKQNNIKVFLLNSYTNVLIDQDGYMGTCQKVDNYDNIYKVIITLYENDLNKYSLGQTYKVQIACIDQNNDIGFLSNTSYIKYSALPTLAIEEFKEENTEGYVLQSRKTYTGSYEIEEKAYDLLASYRFQLCELSSSGEQTILDDTGEQIYTSGGNNSNRTENNKIKITVPYECYYQLDLTKTYVLKFSTTSINGINVSTSYQIKDIQINWQWFDGELQAINNSDAGCVSIYMINKYLGLSAKDKKLINGKFILSRASEEDNYSKWYDIKTYNWVEKYATEQQHLWDDYTVEQGISYKYAVQLINESGIRTTRTITDSVYVDYEDCFLYDGNQSLRLRFNTKISSFKTNILEQKIETIGSKFPFFVRNGRVEYKEFPISGLISYLMMNEDEFIDKLNIGLEEDERIWSNYGRYIHEEDLNSNRPFSPTTNLTEYNIAAERRFKLSVLDWLNNGEPKLFKSPTEGMYLVRLMNTSLTPEETIGRMLHNFSTTAYEIDEHDPITLTKYNIIQPDEIISRSYLTGETIVVNAKDIQFQALPNYFKTDNLFAYASEGSNNQRLIVGFDIDSTIGYDLQIELRCRNIQNYNYEIKTIRMTEQHYAIQPEEGFYFDSCVLRCDKNPFVDQQLSTSGPVITVTYYYFQTPYKSWFNAIENVQYGIAAGESYIGEHNIENEIVKNYFIYPNNIFAVGARYRPLIELKSFANANFQFFNDEFYNTQTRFYIFELDQDIKENKKEYYFSNKIRNKKIDGTNKTYRKWRDLLKIKSCLYYFTYQNFSKANKNDENAWEGIYNDLFSFLYPKNLSKEDEETAYDDSIYKNKRRDLFNIVHSLLLKDTDEIIYDPRDRDHLYLPENKFFEILYKIKKGNLTGLNLINDDINNELINLSLETFKQKNNEFNWQSIIITNNNNQYGIKCYNNTFTFGIKKQGELIPWIQTQSNTEIDIKNNSYELYPNELTQQDRTFEGIKNLSYMKPINKHYIIYKGNPELTVNNLIMHSSMGIVVDISYNYLQLQLNLTKADVLDDWDKEKIHEIQKLFSKIYYHRVWTNENVISDLTVDTNELGKEIIWKNDLWGPNGYFEAVNQYSALIQDYLKTNNMIDTNNKLWLSLLERGRGQ